MQIQTIQKALAARDTRSLVVDRNDDDDPWTGIADTLELSSDCQGPSCATQFAAAEARLQKREVKLAEAQVAQIRRQRRLQNQWNQRIQSPVDQESIANKLSTWAMTSYDSQPAAIAPVIEEPAAPGLEMDAHGNPILPPGAELDPWGNMVFR